MSVTDDPIPHGLKGARKPWCCRCDICVKANRAYNNSKSAEYKARDRDAARADELAAKREAKRKDPPAKRTDPSGSLRKGRKAIGEMERAVIEEASAITDAKPTLIVAARNLARLIDMLSADSKGASVQNSTTKQLMSVMADLRGDKSASKATGRRKSGGRLATVGNLTKVKRA